MSVSVSVSLSVFQTVCPYLSLPVCLSVSQSVCLSVLSACLSVYLSCSSGSSSPRFLCSHDSLVYDLTIHASPPPHTLPSCLSVHSPQNHTHTYTLLSLLVSIWNPLLECKYSVIKKKKKKYPLTCEPCGEKKV